MFDAQLLIEGSVVYSPWFARGGDNAIFTLDVVQYMLGTNNSLTVEVLTKSSEDTGDGDAISNVVITATAAGRSSVECDSTVSNGINELVRYKFTVSGDSTGSVLFRMLTPVWFDEVSA